jgi:hypothetical protein
MFTYLSSIFQIICILLLLFITALSYLKATPPYKQTNSPAKMCDLEYIEANELVAHLKKDYLEIIDVRDSDFYGGHITGAVNKPVDNWTIDEYVTELANEYLGLIFYI